MAKSSGGGGAGRATGRGEKGESPAEAVQTGPLSAKELSMMAFTERTGREYGVMVLPWGKQIEKEGDETSVSIRGRAGLFAGGTFTHTHPGRGGSFSDKDIVFARYHNLAEMRAVIKHPSGRIVVRSMKPGPQGWGTGMTVVGYKTAIQQLRISANVAAQRSGTSAYYDAWDRGADAFWQGYAQQHGLIYTSQFIA